MILIQEEPFDVNQIASRLVTPRVGAVVTFTGVVRGQTGDKRAERLELQVYDGLAEERLGKLREKVMGRFEVEDVAIVHRRGTLRVGEHIVCIAVAAAHRKAAFEACEYAIDRLKREIPIWKKEYTPEGAYWVYGEGCEL